MIELLVNIASLSVIVPGVTFNTLIGIGASLFTAVSMLPQLFKIIKDKKSGDISTWMLFILFTGLSLWVYYGALVNDLIIIISNAISVGINLLIIIFSLKYKQKSPDKEETL